MPRKRKYELPPEAAAMQSYFSGMRAQEEKVCAREGCGKTFTAIRKAKYCTTYCRTRAAREAKRLAGPPAPHQPGDQETT